MTDSVYFVIITHLTAFIWIFIKLCKYITGIVMMCMCEFDEEKKSVLTGRDFKLSHFTTIAPSQ